MIAMPAIRHHAATLSTLVVCSVLVGASAVVIPVLTVAPLAALPTAVGLPTLIPPLNLWPWGDSTWLYWFIDLVGVAVMLVVALAHLEHSRKRRPERGRGRFFGAALWASVLGVVAGNTVRFVFVSLAIQMGPLVFLGLLLVNALVSAGFGLMVGVVAGFVATAVPRPAAKKVAVDSGA